MGVEGEVVAVVVGTLVEDEVGPGVEVDVDAVAVGLLVGWFVGVAVGEGVEVGVVVDVGVPSSGQGPPHASAGTAYRARARAAAGRAA